MEKLRIFISTAGLLCANFITMGNPCPLCLETHPLETLCNKYIVAKVLERATEAAEMCKVERSWVWEEEYNAYIDRFRQYLELYGIWFNDFRQSVAKRKILLFDIPANEMVQDIFTWVLVNSIEPLVVDVDGEYTEEFANKFAIALAYKNCAVLSLIFGPRKVPTKILKALKINTSVQHLSLLGECDMLSDIVKSNKAIYSFYIDCHNKNPDINCFAQVLKEKKVERLYALSLNSPRPVDLPLFFSGKHIAKFSLSAKNAEELFTLLNAVAESGGELPPEFKIFSLMNSDGMQTLSVLVARSKALEILTLDFGFMGQMPWGGVKYLMQGIIKNYLNNGILSLVKIASDYPFSSGIKLNVFKNFDDAKILYIACCINQNLAVISDLHENSIIPDIRFPELEHDNEKIIQEALRMELITRDQEERVRSILAAHDRDIQELMLHTKHIQL